MRDTAHQPRLCLHSDTHSACPPGCVHMAQVKYGQFMNGLSESNITLNRKILSELAAKEPYSFKALVDQVKFMKGAS